MFDEKVSLFPGNCVRLKQQVLDALQKEHGVIMAQVKEQEEYLAGLEADYRDMDAEFCQRKLEGIAILDAMRYEQYLRAMERQIQQAVYRLEELRRQEEAKRLEVVAAKQDTSSIEKLKEKKLDSYNKAVQKSEEAMIDEFVSTTRAMAALQGA